MQFTAGSGQKPRVGSQSLSLTASCMCVKLCGFLWWCLGTLGPDGRKFLLPALVFCSFPKRSKSGSCPCGSSLEQGKTQRDTVWCDLHCSKVQKGRPKGHDQGVKNPSSSAVTSLPDVLKFTRRLDAPEDISILQRGDTQEEFRHARRSGQRVGLMSGGGRGQLPVLKN